MDFTDTVTVIISSPFVVRMRNRMMSSSGVRQLRVDVVLIGVDGAALRGHLLNLGLDGAPLGVIQDKEANLPRPPTDDAHHRWPVIGHCPSTTPFVGPTTGWVGWVLVHLSFLTSILKHLIHLSYLIAQSSGRQIGLTCGLYLMPSVEQGLIIQPQLLGYLGCRVSLYNASHHQDNRAAVIMGPGPYRIRKDVVHPPAFPTPIAGNTFLTVFVGRLVWRQPMSIWASQPLWLQYPAQILVTFFFVQYFFDWKSHDPNLPCLC
jgi:hypothetical protein